MRTTEQIAAEKAKAREKVCEAADWLAEHEWAQGSYYGSLDQMGWVAANPTEEPMQACAIGALRVVCDKGDDGVYHYGKRYLSMVFVYALDLMDEWAQRQLHDGDTYADTFDWNDSESQTKEQVVAGMRDAGQCGKEAKTDA